MIMKIFMMAFLGVLRSIYFGLRRADINIHKFVDFMYAYLQDMKDDNEVMERDYKEYLVDWTLYSHVDRQFQNFLAVCMDLDFVPTPKDTWKIISRQVDDMEPKSYVGGEEQDFGDIIVVEEVVHPNWKLLEDKQFWVGWTCNVPNFSTQSIKYVLVLNGTTWSGASHI